MTRIFLLSRARCDGPRARVLLNPHATFALAERLRSDQGAPLGDLFSFLSGLYFRGKLAYSNAFGRASRRGPAALVITTDRGLLPPDTAVTRADLLAFSKVDLGARSARFTAPLRRDAEGLADSIPRNAQVVLLGSIATGKYVDTLADVFGERLLFPLDFVGRGDMSRGGLLLRCVREERELEYAPVIGAVRHGKRPPKLERMK
jgi:hypothetical protein